MATLKEIFRGMDNGAEAINANFEALNAVKSNSGNATSVTFTATDKIAVFGGNDNFQISMKDGFCYIGFMLHLAGASGPTEVCILPDWARPPYEVKMACIASDDDVTQYAGCLVSINSSGSVKLQGGHYGDGYVQGSLTYAV